MCASCTNRQPCGRQGNFYADDYFSRWIANQDGEIMHKILMSGTMGNVGPELLVKHLRKTIPEDVLIGQRRSLPYIV